MSGSPATPKRAAGAHITEVVVNHRPRLFGTSKYGLWRTFKVTLDLITVYAIAIERVTGKQTALPAAADQWPGKDNTKSPEAGTTSGE